MDTVEDLKKEIVDLKIRVTRLEEFVRAMPSGNDFIQEQTESYDALFPDAVKVIQDHDEASASLLQRKLVIGYARAARILDQLERDGYVGKGEGAKPRKVLKKD